MNERINLENIKRMLPTITIAVILRSGLSMPIVLWCHFIMKGVSASLMNLDVTLAAGISQQTKIFVNNPLSAVETSNYQEADSSQIGPFDELFYNFECNDDIEGLKASTAYHRFMELTVKETKDMDYNIYNKLLKSKNSDAIKYTNTKNIGIVHVIAKTMSLDKDKFAALCHYQLENGKKSSPRLLKLFVELACHIKMREKNGTIDLSYYEKYLYAIPRFANGMTKFKDLAAIDRIYYEAYNIKNDYSFLEGIRYYNLLPDDAIWKEAAKKLLTRENKRKNQLTFLF